MAKRPKKRSRACSPIHKRRSFRRGVRAVDVLRCGSNTPRRTETLLRANQTASGSPVTWRSNGGEAPSPEPGDGEQVANEMCRAHNCGARTWEAQLGSPGLTRIDGRIRLGERCSLPRCVISQPQKGEDVHRDVWGAHATGVLAKPS